MYIRIMILILDGFRFTIAGSYELQNVKLGMWFSQIWSHQYLLIPYYILQHEKICEFPSKEFYEGRLKAHPSVVQQFCKLEGFWPMGPQYPIVFCDIEGVENRGKCYMHICTNTLHMRIQSQVYLECNLFIIYSSRG